jgi:hypothetical protein
MNYINLPNNGKIYIDFRVQVGSIGNAFRLSGLKKVLNKPSRYINRVEKWHWIYTFIYEDGKTFGIEIDYNDHFVCKC